ncbi:MAG TPA: penicillin-binding transpeptidase domain-containing protein [Cellulomonas sp.]
MRTAPGRGARTRTAALVAVALLVGGVAACSPHRPTPDAEAAALASALASGDFTGVALVAGAPDPTALATARTAAFTGLGDVSPQVSVTSVAVDTQDGTKATAGLHWSWDLGVSQPWTYDVTAQLDLVDGDGGAVWRAQWHPSLLAPDLSDGEVLSTQRVAAERGTVLAGNGDPIVIPRPVWHVGIDKTHVAAAAQDASARALATALGMDPDAYAATVAAAGPKAFVEAITVRQDDATYDVAALRKIPGVNAVNDELPLAPTRLFARPILGQTGQATKEIIDASGGAIVAGDLTGLSGLQRQYDEQLRGTPGLTVVASAGPVKRQLFHVDAVAGVPLQTTLDVALQTKAEQILAPVAGNAALVAIRPSTGEILAAASGPNGDGLSTATVGQYAPGSTFKVASTLALLRAGLTPDSTVSCPKSLVVDGYEFDDVPDYPKAALGDIPLRTAFAHSCNTAFAGQAATVPQDALIDAARSLGLDPAPSLGFPAFLATVPADSTGTDHAASLIGQGRVLASPLGMAVAAASVAAGHTVTPVLVKPATSSPASDETPAPVSSATTPATPASPLTQAEADTLRALMRAVVTDGTATLLQDVPAPDVEAKTGTAQFQTDQGLANHAWLIAIHGDLAVAAFVETGDFGATTAGPLVDQFLKAAG